MNSDRAERILEGQSALCRRIHKVVPIQQWWTPQEIANELSRIEGGAVPSRAIVMGVLNTLKECGVVREDNKLGAFQSTVKPANPVIKGPPEMEPKKKATATAKPSIMERLFSNAVHLRSLADEMEALGLEIEEALAEAGKGSEKIQAIKANLRELLGETP